MKLYAVGIGPGDREGITEKALAALRECEVLAGYGPYLTLLGPLAAGKELISTAMRGEVERCRLAVEAALAGKKVAVVSSGDAGVYGMAGLLLELAVAYPQLEVEVVPGVTAASSAAALLGAPLTQDFAVISLSDLLTPLAKIEKRLRLAAEADFVLCLYNPASRKRADYLARACEIVLESRSGDTPCGVARNVARQGQQCRILPLRELAGYEADMFTTVVIGNSETEVLGGRLVTPRGYRGM